MLKRRRSIALLSLAALASAVVLSLTTAAAPHNGNPIVIADDLADEFNPVVAYDPAADRYTIVYQMTNNAYRRDLSADGQTLEAAPEAFDASGNVGDPLAAVAADGLSLYPFADRRFDASTDVMTKRRDANAATFSAQLPIANGAGEQSPACVAAPVGGDTWFAWFYQQADATASRQLLARRMPGGLPLGQPVPLLNSVQNAYVDEAASTTHREVSDGACFTDAAGHGHIYLPTVTLGDEGFTSTLAAYSVNASGTPAAPAPVVQLPIGALADVAVGTTTGGVHLVYVTDVDGDRAIRLANLPAPSGPISQTLDLRTENDPLQPAADCLPGGVCLVVWQEFGVGGQDDVWGVFLVDGAPGTPFAVASTEVAERNPSVAANGDANQFAVVWEEGLDGGRDVRLVILTDLPGGSATPTATATPTQTPPVSASPTPTATAAPTGDRHIYLPMALRQ